MKISLLIALVLFFSAYMTGCLPIPQNSQGSEKSGDYYHFIFSKAHIDDPLDQQQRAEDSANMIADRVEKLDDFNYINRLNEMPADLQAYARQPTPFLVNFVSLYQQLDFYAEEVKEKDTVVIYSHTHGSKLGITIDISKKTLRDLGVSDLYGVKAPEYMAWKDYFDHIEKIKAKNLIILMMACYSGSFVEYLNSVEIKPRWEKLQAAGRNFIVLTSQDGQTTSTPVSIDGVIINPFTYALDKAFAGAAKGNDNITTFGEFVTFTINLTKKLGNKYRQNDILANPQVTGSYDPKAAFFSQDNLD